MAANRPECDQCLDDIHELKEDLRAIRASLEGPEGIHTRLAVIERDLDTLAKRPAFSVDPKWLGGLLAAMMLAFGSGGSVAAWMHGDPCETTCQALGLGEGSVGKDGVCDCAGAGP